jgi:GTP 3',8-cyclase
MQNPELIDRYNRVIDYLRISVTDRCNLKCSYCCDGEKKDIRENLSDKKIIEIASAASKIGFKKVRLTGGEPLLRKNIASIADVLRNRLSYPIVAITTNATLLTHKMCDDLYCAGVTHLTISLDSLNRDVYRQITGSDCLGSVLDAVEYASTKGFECIKINTVVFSSTTKDEIEIMRKYCDSLAIKLQTIGKFSLTRRDRQDKTVMETDRPLPCSKCNRIRVSCDGYIFPCLFSDLKYPVNFENIKETIYTAVANKPQSGSSCSRNTLQSIGG